MWDKIRSLFLRNRRDIAEQERQASKATIRYLATQQVGLELGRLLDEGYEKHPTIRAGGPLMDSWPHAVDWFGAAQMMIIRDFIHSKPIWRGHEDEPIAECDRVIIGWCQAHGGNADMIFNCQEIIDRFRPIFDFAGADKIHEMRSRFLEWAKEHPNVEKYWPRISLYLADDGLVKEYLGSARAFFNEY